MLRADDQVPALNAGRVEGDAIAGVELGLSWLGAMDGDGPINEGVSTRPDPTTTTAERTTAAMMAATANRKLDRRTQP